MSRKKQKEKLLLTREGKLIARIISAGIDSFLSILRSESPYKITAELGITHLPNWEHHYQTPCFIRKLTEEPPKGSSTASNESIPIEQYECFIRVLTQRFEAMASAAQAGNIDWETIVDAVSCYIKNQSDQTKENFIDLFLKARACVFATASIIIFNKPINILYEEAKNGKDESLFKLISLDKAIITAEWANLRVRKATLDGDWDFFDKLGTALNKKSYSKKKQIRLAAFLLIFWRVGFEELNYLERVEFLQDFGFKEKEIPEQDTLRQLIYRLQIQTLLDNLFQNYLG